MKIGTKSNAINDLGKFDGSKMTIKVNGKQIYPQKRYSIVRVDNMCPAITEEGINICKTDKNCRNKCPYKYGDTKEQLIAKIEQVLQWERLCGAKIDDTVAEKIVEFLGVE